VTRKKRCKTFFHTVSCTDELPLPPLVGSDMSSSTLSLSMDQPPVSSGVRGLAHIAATKGVTWLAHWDPGLRCWPHRRYCPLMIVNLVTLRCRPSSACYYCVAWCAPSQLLAHLPPLPHSLVDSLYSRAVEAPPENPLLLHS